MTKFYEKSAEERIFNTKEEWAETEGEKYISREGHFIIMRGLQKPPISINKLSKKLAHFPDFLVGCGDTGQDSGNFYFLECKGAGKDSMIKIKEEDIKILHEWNTMHPVKFLFHNNVLNFTRVISLDSVQEMIDETSEFLEKMGSDRPYLPKNNLYPDNHKLFYPILFPSMKSWRKTRKSSTTHEKIEEAIKLSEPKASLQNLLSKI